MLSARSSGEGHVIDWYRLDSHRHRSIVKISSLGALALTPEDLRLVLIADRVETPRCHLELSTAVFEEYRIESKANNCIFFEIGVDFLQQALQSIRGSGGCGLRLVKRNDRPCLAVSSGGAGMEVCHDIPIKLLFEEDMRHYSPPQVPPPELSLELPRSKLLRVIVDRMSKIDRTLSLRCSSNGRIVVEAKSIDASVRTFFHSLEVLGARGDGGDGSEESAVTVCTDARKLLAVLGFYNIPHLSAAIRRLCI